MKLYLVLLFCYLAVSPAGCHDKNIQPDLPADLNQAQRAAMLQQWTDGKLLFKANCASCHGVFTKGRDSVPNFNKVQIDRYATRFLARDQKNHAVMRQITPQDFYKITTFLTYIKRKEPLKPAPPSNDPFHRRMGMPGN